MNSGLMYWSLEWSLWVLALAASLLGLYAWLSSVILLSKTLLKDAWKNYWRKRASDVVTTTRTGFTGIEVAGLCFIVAAISFTTGYMARDVKQFNHTATFYNVHIIKQDAPDLYTVAIAGRLIELKFCPDYLPDFDPGSVLTTLVYEDRGPCKSISGNNFGYTVLRNIAGKPVIFAKGAVP